ncbi:MAG: anhydro-N-acetylmuramic acid kinase [Bacteroidales bacterium]
MAQKQFYSVIGLMSGSSLDGLDLVCCRFEKSDQNWKYVVEAADCFSYSEEMKKVLSSAYYLSMDKIRKLDLIYGEYLATQLNHFIRKYNLNPDFIASHGHTVLHRPDEGITVQIGNGQIIANNTHFPVVNDFRSLDVKKGGQGAPLVPVGDRLLFNEYGICLNIGGIANLSFEKDCKRIAYDICLANQALNYLASKIGLPYDPDGEYAGSGRLVPELLYELNDLDYYRKSIPKSLGREYFESNFLPLLSRNDSQVQDLLCTVSEHIALQISYSVSEIPTTSILVTGGGAYNTYLIDRLRENTHHQIIIPEPQTVNFKEAIVFAFLGLLRWHHEINCLCSVTGASEDSCTGEIWHQQIV